MKNWSKRKRGIATLFLGLVLFFAPAIGCEIEGGNRNGCDVNGVCR